MTEPPAALALAPELATLLARPRPRQGLTANQRTILAFLAARPDHVHTPAQMIHDDPADFAGRSIQGLHQTAVSLVDKRLAWRTQTDAGVGYQIRPEAIPDLLAAERDDQ
jgi:hypothetical protein